MKIPFSIAISARAIASFLEMVRQGEEKYKNEKYFLTKSVLLLLDED